MGLYDKYARLAGERLQFSDNGLTPFGTCIDEVYSATEGRIGNKKVILAGTNNYLGLTFNHDAIREGQAALGKMLCTKSPPCVCLPGYPWIAPCRTAPPS